MTVMNTTPTTLSDALGRRRRWLAAALLGLALLASQAAEAQIAFRNAASSSAVLPGFRAASEGTIGITFGAAGTAVSGTGSVSPAWPAHGIDDIALLFIESAGGQAATLSTPAGFVAVTNSPQATGATTAGTRITVFWARATSASMSAPTVADPGDHVYAQILTYRGVINTGDPWDVTGGGVKASASTTVTVTGVTTTVPKTLIVQAVARDNDSSSSAFSAQTNANLTGITERTDAGTSSNNGGGFAVWDGVKATAGATGNTTATVTSSINAFLTVALRPGTTSLTIAQPSGTIQDDVMIASVAVTPSTTTITPPAGWTLVRRTDNGSATTNSLAVYRKAAGASEPTAYTWTLGGATAAAGGIQTFINVDTANPIDVENGQTTASGTAHATPSVTTTVANAMVVTSHSFASSATWSSPSGMNEEFDIASETPTVSAGISITGAWVRQAAAGATGAKSRTASGSADTGNAHILALKPATGPLTINKPAGTVANDVMVAAIAFNHDSVVITPPAGWTLVRRVENTDAILGLEVHYRVAGASEPASYTWLATTGSANFQYVVGGIQSFSGVDTVSPIDVDAGQCTPQPTPCGSSSLTHATPDVTTTVSDTMLVTAHTYESSNTWTPPAGMTEAYDQAALATPTTDGMSIEGNYQQQVAAGATGAKTATAAGTSDDGVTHILALKPAPPLPGDFNAYASSTAAGATTGVITTKRAGTTISIDIISVNAARTAILTTFTGTVKVELLNASDNSGAFNSATACRSSWTVIQTLTTSLTFAAGDNGRKTLSFTEANSYPNARLRITYPTTSPTATGCSLDNFAIRPDTFASYSVTDATWLTAGTTRTLNNTTLPGGTVHKAGRPFTVRATAVNGAGSPATTTNYTGAPTPTLTDCGGSSACPSTLGTVTLGSSFIAGVLTANTASYSEVGSFALQLVDSSFASVDAGDTAGDCTTSGRYVCSATTNVGRFVPDNFAVALNTPSFGTACGAFTYVGQKFTYATAPVITVTARNFAGGTTANYAGALWQITAASLTGKSYTWATGTLDTSGITGTDPVISSGAGGVGTLTFGSGTGLFFTRATPVAPFDADISLAINVIDADGVTYASNPAQFGAPTAGNGIAFSSGKPMRFGRLVSRNANGSQLLPLPVQVEAQYWSGAPTNAFITNTLDNCTSIASANDAMGNYTGNLSGSPTCETAISGGGPLSMGRRTLLLAAPGGGNNGSVNLTINLGAAASGSTCTTQGGAPGSATTANFPHLQGNWTGVNYDQNPTARATFGVSRGAEEVIFVRENF
jgi:hypothetical protein